MHRSGKQQSVSGRSAADCRHENTLNLLNCKRLHTLGTAQSTDIFRQNSSGLPEFTNLCVQAPCSHFKRSFKEHLWLGVCQALVKALQLLHSSGCLSFQQQSLDVLQGVYALPGSLNACIGAFDAVHESLEWC